MRLSKLLIPSIVGLLVVSSDHPVPAATATANLPVNAAVAANCSITTTPVTFATYDPIVTHILNPDDSTAGAVTIACTKNTTTNIGLGLGGNALVNQRRMKDATTNYLNFELYKDSARTQVWGNASPNWLTPVAAPDRTARSFTVYGRIPGTQDVPAGSYSETVVATVNF
jgi:spore coat protein U-like protein